jgi:hypothetical protein
MGTYVRDAQPNAHVRLRRAIERRALWIAEDAASELPHLSLEDALQLVHLYAERGSPKYERAALRWLERYLAEGEPRLRHFADVSRAWRDWRAPRSARYPHGVGCDTLPGLPGLEGRRVASCCMEYRQQRAGIRRSCASRTRHRAPQRGRSPADGDGTLATRDSWTRREAATLVDRSPHRSPRR